MSWRISLARASASRAVALLVLPIVPRVVVYLGDALTLSLSHKSSFGSAMLTIIALLYPHLLLCMSRRFFKHSTGARYSVLVDLVLVASLIVVMDFNLRASLTLFVCLIISTLLICPLVVLLMNIFIVFFVCGFFSLLPT